jgi:Lrp/AsnC family transcriptional regulator for asnA, asnC and gidA
VTDGRSRSLPPDRLPYDPVDRKIIGLLQQDGRMSNSEIARRLGVAEATVRKRLHRLLSQGIILVVAVPSPETVGLTQSAIISVSCELQLVDQVAEALEALPETRYLGYSAGSYDLIMECFFYSHEHLLEFMRSKVAPIRGVRSTQTSIILKVRKFSYEWELPEMEEDDAGGPAIG